MHKTWKLRSLKAPLGSSSLCFTSELCPLKFRNHCFRVILSKEINQDLKWPFSLIGHFFSLFMRILTTFKITRYENKPAFLICETVLPCFILFIYLTRRWVSLYVEVWRTSEIFISLPLALWSQWRVKNMETCLPYFPWQWQNPSSPSSPLTPQW